jgi:hypothetical protein
MSNTYKIPLEDNVEIEIPKELIDPFVKSWAEIEKYSSLKKFNVILGELAIGILEYYYRYLHEGNVETFRTFLSDEDLIPL